MVTWVTSDLAWRDEGASVWSSLVYRFTGVSVRRGRVGRAWRLRAAPRWDVKRGRGKRAPTTTQPTTLMRACRRWERDDTLQLATYTADLHYIQLSIRTGSAPRLKLWSAARSPPPEKTPILSRLMCLKQNVARAQATAGSWLRPTSQRQARHQLNNTI